MWKTRLCSSLYEAYHNHWSCVIVTTHSGYMYSINHFIFYSLCTFQNTSQWKPKGAKVIYSWKKQQYLLLQPLGIALPFPSFVVDSAILLCFFQLPICVCHYWREQSVSDAFCRTNHTLRENLKVYWRKCAYCTVC